MGLTDNSTTIPRIMVFRPKLEEMKDFSKYLEFMESQGAYKAGLAKIIPPKEWKPRKNGYEDIDIMIKAPIQQVVTGGQGLYQQYNIQKKSMNVKDFKKLANSAKYQPPQEYFDYKDLERKYWKNVTFCPAIYGADVSGTLTDEDCKEFNINNLNTCLDMINESYGIKIMGVNTAYLYFGMWKTTFAWHTEDMDLYSINYLHFGAPKSWYCIPPEHGKRLERLANGFFPNSYKQCPAFLRHKMTLISPQVLKKYSIPYNKITQEEGEFMITFPYSYHAGFNHGYNCAESTNFALPRWVEFGKRAVRCNCRSDSVKISMEAFVKKFQPDRYDLWLEGKDVGPDPKDPSHICAAPAPSNYEKDIMSKFNKPKRHPPHKKDFSSDTEDCCSDEDDCQSYWSPPTKAARKMFDSDIESVPSIASISADTISSMPKPPTILETIHRLHQNLNSSTNKSQNELKEKKRKKRAIETTIPPHLLNHSYAKPSPSCTQPNNNNNYEYFAQLSQKDSNIAKPIEMSDRFGLNGLSSIQSTSLSQTSFNSTMSSPEVKLFSNPTNGVSVKTESNGLDGQLMVSQPPNIKPYYEYTCADYMEPSSQPPLLKPPEMSSIFNQTNNFVVKTQVNGLNTMRRSDASTSTEDLDKRNGRAVDTPSVTTPSQPPSAANNICIFLEELTKSTLQYTPPSFGPSPHGFADEIKFNICMSTISPYCAVCNLLKDYEMSSVFKLSELESWSPPKSSPILIPSIAFTSKVKDETTLLDSRETSPLIVCMDCRICVHSVCYGVSDLLFDGSERNWKCDRCAQKDYYALCCLCPNRGGPLKETTEKIKEKKWVHLSCALLVPDVKFVNGILKKPIELKDLKTSRRTDKMGCIYCRKVNPDNKIVDYFTGYCIQCVCYASFHVTCGHRHGVQYRSGDWPDPIRISCKKCCITFQSKKKQISKRDLSEVQTNTIVIAKHRNNRYYKGMVVDKHNQLYHHIHFVDNSYTSLVKSCDILNRDCEADPPEVGDAVEVIWNKEQLHGKYTGNHTSLLYNIGFDDGSEIRVKREDFYLQTEELPKKVKTKLSMATERQFTKDCEESISE